MPARKILFCATNTVSIFSVYATDNLPIVGSNYTSTITTLSPCYVFSLNRYQVKRDVPFVVVFKKKVDNRCMGRMGTIVLMQIMEIIDDISSKIILAEVIRKLGLADLIYGIEMNEG